MGTTVRIRRYLREQPSSDLLRVLLDRPASEFESRWAVLALTADDLSAGWLEHGAQITHSWARRFGGTRPSCWWRFESPEPRRLLRGAGGIPAGCVATFAYGLPCGLWISGTPAPRFESQFQFLRRHHLLLPDEGRPIREPHPDPAHLAFEWWQQYSRPGHEAPRLPDGALDVEPR
jgi:hypothetical protein